MTEYKPFDKIEGAIFIVENNLEFYNLFDLLQDFKEKIQEIEKEIQKLDKNLTEIPILQNNFLKRVTIKTKLLRQKEIANYIINIFTTKFIKKVEKIIEKEKKIIEAEELEEFLEEQNNIIKKMKKILKYFKEKEEEEKRLEQYLTNNNAEENNYDTDEI